MRSVPGYSLLLTLEEPVQAQLTCDFLRGQSVPAFLDGVTQRSVTLLTTPHFVWHVYVQDRWIHQSLTLLQAWDQASLEVVRSCSSCGEIIEPPIQLCWNCAGIENNE